MEVDSATGKSSNVVVDAGIFRQIDSRLVAIRINAPTARA